MAAGVMLVIAPVVAAEWVQKCPTGVEAYTALPGNTAEGDKGEGLLGDMAIIPLKDCAEGCSENPECSWFSYVHETSACRHYLESKAYTATTNAAAVAYIRRHDPGVCFGVGFSRSEKTCEELGWNLGGKTKTQKGIELGVCSPSSASDCEDRQGQYVWDAKTLCAAAGARLCTHEELQAKVTKGSDCELDSDLIWTRSDCTDDQGNNGKRVAKGADGDGMTCSAAWGDKRGIRCCGDKDPVSYTSTCTSVSDGFDKHKNYEAVLEPGAEITEQVVILPLELCAVECHRDDECGAFQHESRTNKCRLLRSPAESELKRIAVSARYFLLPATQKTGGYCSNVNAEVISREACYKAAAMAGVTEGRELDPTINGLNFEICQPNSPMGCYVHAETVQELIRPSFNLVADICPPSIDEGVFLRVCKDPGEETVSLYIKKKSGGCGGLFSSVEISPTTTTDTTTTFVTITTATTFTSTITSTPITSTTETTSTVSTSRNTSTTISTTITTVAETSTARTTTSAVESRSGSDDNSAVVAGVLVADVLPGALVAAVLLGVMISSAVSWRMNRHRQRADQAMRATRRTRQESEHTQITINHLYEDPEQMELPGMGELPGHRDYEEPSRKQTVLYDSGALAVQKACSASAPEPPRRSGQDQAPYTALDSRV